MRDSNLVCVAGGIPPRRSDVYESKRVVKLGVCKLMIVRGLLSRCFCSLRARLLRMKGLLGRALRFRELRAGTNLAMTSLVKLRFEVLFDWRGGQAAIRGLIILASSGNI